MKDSLNSGILFHGKYFWYPDKVIWLPYLNITSIFFPTLTNILVAIKHGVLVKLELKMHISLYLSWNCKIK